MMEKLCNVCKQSKPLEMFGVDKHGRDGRRSICKECRAAEKRAQYTENPELFRARSRAWADLNPEANRAKAKAWRDANPDRVKAQTEARADHERLAGRERRAANKEKYSAKAKAWRDANPDYYMRHAAMFPEQRKARRAVNGEVRAGRLPAASTCKCSECGAQAQEYHHPDYSKPLEVVPVCKACHTKIHYGF